jgi:hypothetical protein
MLCAGLMQSFVVSVISPSFAGDPNSRGALAETFEEAEARLKPFDGARAPGGVDTSTVDGKVIVGYQGWFFTPGDGSGRGWVHYAGGKFMDGMATVDMWPDMSEMTPAEQYETGFNYPDGSPATVFSSYNPLTVNRHFKWMADYGIDGAFVQRFISGTRNPKSFDANNAVLDNVRRAANANGRTFAVMYDLSGLRSGEALATVSADWKRLAGKMQITRDPSYQRHHGKPLVILWGVGFGRKYTTPEIAAVVDFLQHDADYGGNAIMLGTPSAWRTGKGDAAKDPDLESLIRKVDIVSPWAVNRYKSPEGFEECLNNYGREDLAWCGENKVDYMPVIFPGFSWNNLMNTRGHDARKEAVPRGDGGFFWAQGSGWIKSGAKMIYIAMFDEIDEGTAIFKISGNPPSPGKSGFITNEDMPSDHYLWLAGRLAKALKNEIPPGESLPRR